MNQTEGQDCPLCNQKLKTAHPLLQEWFPRIKIAHPGAHISWAWRGEEDQNTFFKNGASDVAWPRSKHNKKDAQNRACAEALDLFKLDGSRARFPVPLYREIAATSDALGYKDKIQWGIIKNGKRKDFGHFQTT
jgi:hypothetical protein